MVYAFLRYFLIFFFPMSVLAQDALQEQNGDVWSHSFYSGEFRGPESRITYIVCNRTADHSDFFWARAGFGIGEQTPMRAQSCLRRDDYVYVEDGTQPPGPSVEISDVFVRDQPSGEVPTLMWCDFLGVDRCGNGLISGAAAWITSLRMLGDGPSGEVELIASTNVQLSEGRYQIEIEYSEDAGSLVAVARNSVVETASFEDPDGQTLEITPLGEFVSLEAPITLGLSEADAAVLLPSFEQTGGLFSFSFQEIESEFTSLSILGVSDGQPIFRFDGVSLDRIEQ